jgi:uncharacterized protein
MDETDVIERSAGVRVGWSDIHGRGVFAVRDFAAGEVVERCPVLVVPEEERDDLDATVLHDHYFEWEDGDGAVPLGLGCLYNHADDPNAGAESDHDELVIDMVAARPIAAGEEITIHYGEGWFEDREEE